MKTMQTLTILNEHFRQYKLNLEINDNHAHKTIYEMGAAIDYNDPLRRHKNNTKLTLVTPLQQHKKRCKIDENETLTKTT